MLLPLAARGNRFAFLCPLFPPHAARGGVTCALSLCTVALAGLVPHGFAMLPAAPAQQRLDNYLRVIPFARHRLSFLSSVILELLARENQARSRMCYQTQLHSFRRRPAPRNDDLNMVHWRPGLSRVELAGWMSPDSRT